MNLLKKKVYILKKYNYKKDEFDKKLEEILHADPYTLIGDDTFSEEAFGDFEKKKDNSNKK